MDLQRKTFLHDGLQRRFLLGVPDRTPPSGRQPNIQKDLLLFLHGSRQSGAVARRFTGFTFDRLAEETGTVICYPDGVAHHFNDARVTLPETTREEGVDDVGFLTALADSLGPRRVFACGFSNGGEMVIRLLRDAPGFLSGAALFSATLPTPENLLPAAGTYLPTPVVLMHGTGDEIVPYDGGAAGLTGDPSRRGLVRSAPDSARILARANGAAEEPVVSKPADGVTRERFEGEFPVELWSMDGVGHVVASPKDLPASLGATTDAVCASDVVRDFFGLGLSRGRPGGAAGRTR